MNEPIQPGMEEMGLPPSPPGIPEAPMDAGTGIPSGLPPGMDPSMFVDTPEMASPEQRQDLLSMIEQIKAKMSNFDAQQFAGKNKTEQTRREILKNVFEILQLSGVDLTSRESVAEFLEKLKTENPQLATWFESSMDVLLGGEDTGLPVPPNSPEVDPGMVVPDENQYENGNPAENIPQDM